MKVCSNFGGEGKDNPWNPIEQALLHNHNHKEFVGGCPNSGACSELNMTQNQREDYDEEEEGEESLVPVTLELSLRCDLTD